MERKEILMKYRDVLDILLENKGEFSDDTYIQRLNTETEFLFKHSTDDVDTRRIWKQSGLENLLTEYLKGFIRCSKVIQVIFLLAHSVYKSIIKKDFPEILEMILRCHETILKDPSEELISFNFLSLSLAILESNRVNSSEWNELMPHLSSSAVSRNIYVKKAAEDLIVSYLFRMDGFEIKFDLNKNIMSRFFRKCLREKEKLDNLTTMEKYCRYTFKHDIELGNLIKLNREINFNSKAYHYNIHSLSNIDEINRCYVDIFQYFSRNDDDMKNDILSSFASYGVINNKKNHGIILTTLSQFPEFHLDFIVKEFLQVLSSFIHEDPNQLPIRDLSDNFGDVKLLQIAVDGLKVLCRSDHYVEKSSFSDHRWKLCNIVKKLSKVDSLNDELKGDSLSLIMITLNDNDPVSVCDVVQDLWVFHSRTTSWKVLDGILNLISNSLLKLANHGFTNLAVFNGFITKTFQNDNSFLRSGCLEILIAFKKNHSDLWNNYVENENKDFDKFLHNVFEDETEGIVRRKASFLASLFDIDRVSPKFRKILINGFFDFDWEVKEILLNFWSKSIEGLLNSGMQGIELLNTLNKYDVIKALRIALQDYEFRGLHNLYAVIKQLKIKLPKPTEPLKNNYKINIISKEEFNNNDNSIITDDDFINMISTLDWDSRCNEFEEFRISQIGLESLLDDMIQSVNQEGNLVETIDCTS